mmetsp:Transcript_8580/g.14464  ORF Transcript_8580/g.14464 Transcript_8580/m.14464 type:complete len:1179 (-) Transcript_8580:110-3646(-)
MMLRSPPRKILKEMKRRESGSKMLLCTACPNKSDAEVIHPQLKVPICGACSAALKDADIALVDNQIQSCTWCGNADFVHLFMCDDCPRSFCEDCVTRNFGTAEAAQVKESDPWYCYVCVPTTKLKTLQVHEDIKYFNIDRAYNSIRPPNVHEVNSKTVALFEKLTPQERDFALIFSGGIGNSFIQDSELIGQYLTAIDFAVVLRVSTGLRKYFQSEVSTIPGLFKTEYGAENSCRLYNHQIVSLNRMTQIENASKEFGALRGGIFGDEPGLGKTVTTLALVASTAGLMPQLPSVFWDKNTIDEHWRFQKGQYGTLLGPVLNALQKNSTSGFRLDHLHHLRVNVEQHCETIGTFETAVRKCIFADVPRMDDRSKLLDLFRQEMVYVKEGLDRSLRKNRTTSTANSPHLQRIKLERALCPSSATLIIVPLALLEHWYEQIKRHLNLQYFTGDAQQRGVVYIDGMGDIVDVTDSLSKTKFETNAPMESARFLSHYLIVVTTFERCAMEYKMRHERGNAVADSSSNMALLQMRWLRLVVDEGHEIGKSSTDLYASRVTKFISQIAAERRWVMSGTPTTGSKSAVALEQLYRLLQFLRHPRLVHNPSTDHSSLIKSESTASLGATATTATVGVKRKSYSDLPSSANDDTNSVSSGQKDTLSDFLSIDRWHKEVIAPCLAQQESAWQSVMDLLQGVLLRHTKADIHLFEPIRSAVNLTLDIPPAELAAYTEEERTRAIDQCKANYIADTINKARLEYKAYVKSGKAHSFEVKSRSILSRMNHNNRLSIGANSAGVATDSSNTSVSTSADMGNKNNTLKCFSLTELMNAKANKTASNVSVENSNRLLEVTDAEKKELSGRVRVPKAIVFSLHDWDLQGVGHELIMRMGPGAICEHFGMYRSAELSRFRHSKKKFRRCPLCSHCNQIGNYCTNILLLVEYTNTHWMDQGDGENVVFPACAGGHGGHGPGGHYLGKCLCSPEGCVPPADQTNNTNWTCGGFPNPFHRADLVAPEHSNHAIVSYEHIDGYVPGRHFNVGDHVHVRRQEVCPQGGAPNIQNPVPNELTSYNLEPTNALLWEGGVLGGHGIVRGWRACGGNSKISNWHGPRVLNNVPYSVESEEASVLLLAEDGSTGLDLSFATHIFLLDRIKDPALRNQIVSRAHRMGAQGPVKVELVQVATDEGDENM